ncbi:hypothetical protein Sme01_64930 [Sphaerisporangium melleum]|uniref:Uncharacterized protein n=1 Tax=Sphaerisporangium melleum TaxID=321316 RepID=A0A917VNU2_9ACTN|nr:hypothetical protein GCM10007964_52380 [Sphaerisporangium melleum]GII74017.1 hypothetical protein Sme01_64930 [Sphaerisporangium melleum]
MVTPDGRMGIIHMSFPHVERHHMDEQKYEDEAAEVVEIKIRPLDRLETTAVSNSTGN